MNDGSHHQSPDAHDGGLAAEQSLDRKRMFSVGLNSVIVIAEVAGGFAAGSLALLSDAMHNLSDVAALALALVARILGRRPPSLRHTYGLRRVEVLAALLNAAVLLVVCTLEPDTVACTHEGLLHQPNADALAARKEDVEPC